MLTSEDEFLVLACDGLWDVMSSQRCMELARTHLRDNNDPQLCAEHLVSTIADAMPSCLLWPLLTLFTCPRKSFQTLTVVNAAPSYQDDIILD